MTVAAHHPSSPGRKGSPRTNAGRFVFDGGVGASVAHWLYAVLLCLVTLGFGFPLALVAVQRWQAAHTLVGGRRLVFTGRAGDLAGSWFRWWPLTVVSLGLYGLSVVPKVRAWVWDHTDYASWWDVDREPETACLNRPLVPMSRLHLAFFSEAGRNEMV
jgi:uncharacterized membrane protein YjgN (DUF898 family)